MFQPLWRVLKVSKLISKKDLTLEDINFRTRMNKFWEDDITLLAHRIKTDPYKKERELCLKCYYSGAMAGQAFTEYACSLCHKVELHHNTSTPILCLDCAKEKKLCANCGGTISGEELESL